MPRFPSLQVNSFVVVPLFKIFFYIKQQQRLLRLFPTVSCKTVVFLYVYLFVGCKRKFCRKFAHSYVSVVSVLALRVSLTRTVQHIA